MIDDKTRISAAAAKSHKRVIWDLQALNCFHVEKEELGIISSHMQDCNTPKQHSHAHQQTRAQNMPVHVSVPPYPPTSVPTHTAAASTVCTLRQLSAEEAGR